ncbi:MAG: DUF3089 domain-containing protein [Raoultibacter sp.]|jgi:hypothetical protein
MKRIAALILILLVCATPLLSCENEETKSESQENTSSVILASDYSDSDNWLVVPVSETHEVDTLYFYPTCYMPKTESDPRICDIDNQVMREGAQAKLLDQASAFEGSTNVYAPYYRQVDAMSLAGLTQEEMIEVESAEPRTDVFAALDYYFENYNQGKPFFLAGHSQGSMMIYLILDEYMQEHPEYYERMVAAYMIGNAATQSWLNENPHVKMAQSEDDTGVLVSWNTEGPGNKGKYNMVAPEGSVCINPLNWKTDDTPAGVEENKGTLMGDGTSGFAVVEGIADAKIDLERGTVICSSVNPAEFAIPAAMESLFGPESYHTWDYKFYYENIRENVAVRAAAFSAQ